MFEQCPTCNIAMIHVHGHDQCLLCGLVIGCCEGAPQPDVEEAQ